jgi:anti-sigma B factor antagonist
MALSIDCKELNGTIRCVIEGDLDLASQQAALEQLIAEIEKRPQVVIFDLSGVEFIDSTGLRVLLTCQQRATEARTSLRLAAVSTAVQRLFEVTKLTDRFDYHSGGYDST